jgi:WD40 repeat protein
MSAPTPEPSAGKPAVISYGHPDPLFRRINRNIPRLRWRTWPAIVVAALAVWWFVRATPVWMSRLIAISDPSSKLGIGNLPGPTVSPDGSKVAFRLDNTLRVFDVPTGREVYSDANPEIPSIEFSHDGRRMLIWQWAMGKNGSLIDLATQRKSPVDARTLRAVFSADDSRLITAGFDDAAIWNTGDGSRIAALAMSQGRFSELQQVLITPDQRLVELADTDGVRFYRIADGMLNHEIRFQPYTSPKIISGRFPGWALATPDGSTVVWCDVSDSVFITDTQTGRNRFALQIAGASREFAALVTGGGSRVLLWVNTQLTLLDISTGATVASAPPWPAGISVPPFSIANASGFSQSPDGRLIAGCTCTNPAPPRPFGTPAQWRTCVFDARTLNLIGMVPGDFFGFQPFSPNCRRLALLDSGAEPQRATIWDSSSWRCTSTFLPGRLGYVAWLNDDSLFTTSASDGRIVGQIWTRHRPEAWYGIAALPQFWLALIAAIFTLVRIRADLHRWYHPILPAGVRPG